MVWHGGVCGERESRRWRDAGHLMKDMRCDFGRKRGLFLGLQIFFSLMMTLEIFAMRVLLAKIVKELLISRRGGARSWQRVSTWRVARLFVGKSWDKRRDELLRGDNSPAGISYS